MTYLEKRVFPLIRTVNRFKIHSTFITSPSITGRKYWVNFPQYCKAIGIVIIDLVDERMKIYLAHIQPGLTWTLLQYQPKERDIDATTANFFWLFKIYSVFSSQNGSRFYLILIPLFSFDPYLKTFYHGQS